MAVFLEDYEKLLVFTVGNSIRGDDGLGPLLSDRLYDKLMALEDKDTDNVFLLNTESTPENHTHEIRNLNPSHMLIIDAVEFDGNAGEMLIITKDMIDTFNVSTHSMPVSFIISYIEESIGTKIMTIGIQPKEMNLVNRISDEVKSSVEDLADLIVDLV